MLYNNEENSIGVLRTKPNTGNRILYSQSKQEKIGGCILFINMYKMSYIPVVIALIITIVRAVYAFLHEEAIFKIGILIFCILMIIASVFILNYYKNSIKSLVADGDSCSGVLLNNRQIQFKQSDIVSIKRANNVTKIVLSNISSYKILDNSGFIKLNKVDEDFLNTIIQSYNTGDGSLR